MPSMRNLSEYYTRPDWVRRINAMGDNDPADACGLPWFTAPQAARDSG